MAVEIWIGEKPEHPNERRAIIALANGLARLDGLYLLLANFTVGGRNIDLVIIKADGIFIVELKHCDGKVFGDVNGPWFVEGGNGERKRINPGRKNPYNQVISYYYSFTNFLNEHRNEILTAQRATAADFRACRRLVVIAPTIQEGSLIETDWKVEARGLDGLPTYLVIERSPEINLSDAEMRNIPERLNLVRWSEINLLVQGAPAWDTPAEPAPPIVEPATIAAAPDPIAAPAPTRWFHTMRGRIIAAVGTSIAAVGVVLALTLAAGQRTPIRDQAQEWLLASTSLPAGGTDAVASPSDNCIWNGYQPVGRRRGTSTGKWDTVTINTHSPALAPDVVVTLEHVTFCNGRIELAWSVRNNLGDATVNLPLDESNVTIQDSLGNTYKVSTAPSKAAVISVAPNSKADGTAVVDRTVDLNAATLVVRLNQLPFGEATWLVPLNGASSVTQP